MKAGLSKRVADFIGRNPNISPPLMRFPIPETFWNAGMHRILFRLGNYSLTAAQMVAKKSKIIGYPSHIYVDPTNVCNLRCPVCPTGCGIPGRPKGSMPLDRFKRIIDEFGKYLVSIDLFNWGEPLFNKDIYKMIAYAHKHHIVTSVSSNLNYFPGNSAEELVSSGLDILILSIDGASQESYEKYRIGGNFSNVIENLSALIAKKKQRGSKTPYIFWQFLVMRQNEHEIETAKEMAIRLGVDQISFDHAYLPVATREEAMRWLPKDPKHHRYNLDELEKTWTSQEAQHQQKVPAQQEQDDLPCTEGSADEEQRQVSPAQPAQNIPRTDLRRRKDCFWLYNQTAINWDGSVSPCCAIYDPATDFGFLSEEPFKKIWNNEKYRAARKFSVTGEVQGPMTICMRCPIAAHG
jgi:radical SAM protein with 4Fe4S-binding SPASM domain